MHDSPSTITRWLRKAAATAGSAALLLAALPATAAAPVNLTIGSFSQGSSWYVYSVNLGELLRTALPPGSKVDTPPLAGGLGNPPLVENGKAQLAFGMAVVGSWALEGTNAYKKPMKDLRALVGGWDEYFLVPMARGEIKSDGLANYFKSVNPKATVTLLQRGSVGAYGGEQMLELAGAGEKALKQQGGDYEFGSFDMVKNRFAAGTADVFVQTATLGHPSITEMARTNTLTFLQPSQSILDEMKKRYGWETHSCRREASPARTRTCGCPGRPPPCSAAPRCRTIWPTRSSRRSARRPTSCASRTRRSPTSSCKKNEVWKRENTGMPLHAGAERYYRERGWLQ